MASLYLNTLCFSNTIDPDQRCIADMIQDRVTNFRFSIPMLFGFSTSTQHVPDSDSGGGDNGGGNNCFGIHFCDFFGWSQKKLNLRAGHGSSKHVSTCYVNNFSLTVVEQFREKQSNRCNSAPYFMLTTAQVK